MKHVLRFLSCMLLKRLPYFSFLNSRFKFNFSSVFLVSVLSLCLFHITNAKIAQVPTKYSKAGRGSSLGSYRSSSSNLNAIEDNEIIDIVGYGEDCSSEDGLLCDEIQNLVCDPSEEICVCDAENGYTHLSQILGSFENWKMSSKGPCARPKTGEDVFENNKLKLFKNVEKRVERLQEAYHKPKSKILDSKSTFVTKAQKVSANDIDVVGYGEDCSLDEGPTCDKEQFLICDADEEICVCDFTKGYIHLSNVPGGEEQHLQPDGSTDLPRSLCISKKKVAERAQEMLLGTSVKTETRLEDLQEQNLNTKSTDEENSSPSPSSTVDSIYDEMFNKYITDNQVNSENQRDRLAAFRLQRYPLNNKYTGDELIVNEIMKYSYAETKINLEIWRDDIHDLLKRSTPWKKNLLAESICTAFFDLDQDKLGTPEEYVIALLSEKVRAVVMPKAFLDMIIPLPEENCITMEDLREYDHNPETFFKDFESLDENHDGCFSFDEYRETLETICVVSWFQVFVKTLKIDFFMAELDPSPEEIFIRRLLRNEKLGHTWKLIDKDQNNYISFEELHNDLMITGYATEDDDSKSSALFGYLDIDKDGKIELLEVKLQIALPSMTEGYQYDWLESLYELFESDEDEVKENLQNLEMKYKELVENLTDTSEDGKPKKFHMNETERNKRLFSIFDKNRNGEWDEVEFKLLMETLTKYVVYELLSEIVDEKDQDKDGKISFFEYEEFFRNSSPSFRISMRNLLALEEEFKEMEEDGEIDSEDYDQDDENIEEGDDEGNQAKDGMVTITVSSRKLSRRAARVNETAMVFKLFLKMDSNLDGFITKEDFYSFLLPHTNKKTKLELEKEFESLDLNKDGIVTSDESEDFVFPADFATYKLGVEGLADDISREDYEVQFTRLDINKDRVITQMEHDINSMIIYEEDEQGKFLAWLELFLKTSPPMHIVDPVGELIFKEMDYNCDGFISHEEFGEKLEELKRKSQAFHSNILKISGKTDIYFNSLDLNRDGMISYNEFHLLLLRSNKPLNQF